MTRRILANSPGWNDSGPILIQIFAPSAPLIDEGKKPGSASRNSPIAPSV